MSSGALTVTRSSTPFRLAFVLVLFIGGVIVFTHKHKNADGRSDDTPPPITTVAGAVAYAEQLKGDLFGDGGPSQKAYLNAPVELPGIRPVTSISPTPTITGFAGSTVLRAGSRPTPGPEPSTIPR